MNWFFTLPEKISTELSTLPHSCQEKNFDKQYFLMTKVNSFEKLINFDQQNSFLGEDFFCPVVETTFKVSWVDIWWQTFRDHSENLKYFWILKKRILDIWRKNLKGLSKRPSMCADAETGGKNFLRKNHFFLFFVRVWPEDFWTSPAF